MPGSTSADAIVIAVEQTPDEIFDEFDTDNSGTIDQTELVRALSKAGIALTKEKVFKLMNTIDTDGGITLPPSAEPPGSSLPTSDGTWA